MNFHGNRWSGITNIPRVSQYQKAASLYIRMRHSCRNTRVFEFIRKAIATVTYFPSQYS